MSDIPDLSIGALAPEFSLPANTGTEISLANFRTKNNVYVFFVREFN
jgi:peroxiredoxin